MKRIVWGLNPFDFDDETVQNTAQTIQSYWPLADILIYFVGSRLDTEINLAFDIPIEERRIQYPLRKLKENLTRIGLADFAEKARATFEYTMSNRALAERFFEYAASVKAEAIVVNTHARKGLERLALGSFTETLTHLSPISILTLNPNLKLRESLNKVLYASDMSDRAISGYDRLIELLEMNKSELIYFHVQFPMLLKNSNLEPDVEPLFEEMERAAALAEKRGLKFRSLLPENVGSVSDQILKASAAVAADLIVLQANVGPVQSMLLGSVSRAVLRKSSIPVLVLK